MKRHRTQLYLDEDQYRWLKCRAGRGGSIASLVRELVDAARASRGAPAEDPFIRYLLEEPPGKGPRGSTVSTIDEDVYGR
ncbi:MAG: hypothetical protein HY775_03025 [Acidobacteria bacterium]|nr:hypothetical protein [Acidobacteriota bacterium]